MKKFTEIKKIDLNNISGGAAASSGASSNATGVESDTYNCTEKDLGFGLSAGDTSHDGDYISTC